jgi:hypothetical protein
VKRNGSGNLPMSDRQRKMIRFLLAFGYVMASEDRALIFSEAFGEQDWQELLVGLEEISFTNNNPERIGKKRARRGRGEVCYERQKSIPSFPSIYGLSSYQESIKYSENVDGDQSNYPPCCNIFCK